MSVVVVVVGTGVWRREPFPPQLKSNPAATIEGNAAARETISFLLCPVSKRRALRPLDDR